MCSLIWSILNKKSVDQPQGLSWAWGKWDIWSSQVGQSRLDQAGLAEEVPSWVQGVDEGFSRCVNTDGIQGTSNCDLTFIRFSLSIPLEEQHCMGGAED